MSQIEQLLARGPGHLASFVPSTGTVSLIDLGGAGEKECISAGWVRTADGLLYVTCSGDFNSFPETVSTNQVSQLLYLHRGNNILQ